MKIYTRTGDDGTTGLIGPGRVRKSELRVECYGTVDELNAALGLAALAVDHRQTPLVRQVQNDLFVVGAHLATPPDSGYHAGLPTLDDALIARLEMEIDAAESRLPALRQFILPGGTEAAARLHLARTICRRAERLVVTLTEDRPVPAVILTYLNRLSDWLFVQARAANHLASVPDVPWTRHVPQAEHRGDIRNFE